MQNNQVYHFVFSRLFHIFVAKLTLKTLSIMASFLTEILKQGVAGQVLQQMTGGQQPAAQQTTTPNGAQTADATVAQNDPNAALKQAAAGAGMGALGQMLQNGKLSSMAGGVLSVIGMATSAMGLVNSVKNLRR